MICVELIRKIALILIIVGALNWLCVGLFEMDIVASIFGNMTHIMSKLIYIIIGISGLISITYLFDEN